MRKSYLFLIFLIFIFLAKGFSNATINIVYPKKNGVTINGKSTFFVGSVPKNQKLYINSQEVQVSPSGAFAQYVTLNKEGNNNFVFKSGNDELKFVINKPFNISCKKIFKTLVEEPLSEYRTTTMTPLRATPVDAGINRLSMLSKDTKLLINGQQGDFARVYLDKNKSAWVLKKDIKLENYEIKSVKSTKIKKFKRKEINNFIVYEINFSDKIPFEIEETDKNLIFNFYNVKNIEEKFQITYSNKKLIGYDYGYKHNKFILKIRQSNDKPIVVIDAGHGGLEHGSIGCGGIPEKDVNLNIAKLTKTYLTEQGVKVLMTREKDETKTLKSRCDLARKNNAQILVSIHANALPDCENPLLHRGTSTYYYHPQAKQLAKIILNKLTTQANTNNDRVRRRSLALTRPTHSVSVLVETGYMINPYDYDLLVNQDFQKTCAKAIADGIIKYLNE